MRGRTNISSSTTVSSEILFMVHYDDVIMSAMASQITSHTIVYSTVYSDADPREHQSSASLAFVWGIHRGPVNSPHKWLVTRKMYPFHDVVIVWYCQRGATINTLYTEQNSRHFADDILKYTYMKNRIMIRFSLVLFPKIHLKFAITWTNNDRAQWRIYAFPDQHYNCLFHY